jgi:RNA polymerase sigma-70 factor (ECF subfamily)
MNKPSTPDADLVQACRQKDRAALETVFRAHLPALERFVARLVGSRADVEDLVQDTLVTAIAAFPGFRSDAPVSTWLNGIAVNVLRRHLRSPAHRHLVSLDLVPAPAEPTDPAAPPDGMVDCRRRVERINAHLSALGPDRRIAFILHVVEGRPIEEVAQIVGVSRMAVKSRIFWARRTLMARVRRDPVLREPTKREGRQ